MDKHKIPVCFDPTCYKLIECIGRENGMINTSQALEKIIRTVLHD